MEWENYFKKLLQDNQERFNEIHTSFDANNVTCDENNNILMPAILKVFNHVLITGEFSKQWNIGVIIPIYKKKETKVNKQTIVALP